jgi:7-cyano-7-deazaguanine reductase
MSDTKKLKSLGSKKTEYVFDQPKPELLEVFENQHQDNYYVIPFECFEFSSLCPKTHQPDMATIEINYIPDKKCVESKSLKLYLFSFRQSGEFMEDVTNRIAKDLFDLLEPLYLQVIGKFNSRGGITLTPFVELLRDDICQEEEDRISAILARHSLLK